MHAFSWSCFTQVDECADALDLPCPLTCLYALAAGTFPDLASKTQPHYSIFAGIYKHTSLCFWGRTILWKISGASPSQVFESIWCRSYTVTSHRFPKSITTTGRWSFEIAVTAHFGAEFAIWQSTSDTWVHSLFLIIHVGFLIRCHCWEDQSKLTFVDVFLSRVWRLWKFEWHKRRHTPIGGAFWTGFRCIVNRKPDIVCPTPLIFIHMFAVRS